MDENTVVAVLKSSRKARKQTTCYPCQRRKVKCDRGLPCAVCVARGHSFLCSYGRPVHSPKIASSFNPGTEEGSHLSGHQLLPGPESQLSTLRDQLNHLHQELHQSRKRHKQCEEAEDHVRRLQARCKEYEAVHISLRAGDWSALARINNLVEDDDNTSSPSSSTSDVPVYPQDTRMRTDKAFILSVNTPQAIEVSNRVGMVHNSGVNSVSTAHQRASELCTVAQSETGKTILSTGSMPNVQQPQRFFEQRKLMPESAVICCPSRVPDGANLSDQLEAASERALQSLASTSSDYAAVLHQSVSDDAQRTRTKSSSRYLEGRHENAILHSLSPSKSSMRKQDQREQEGQASQAPAFVANSNAILLNSTGEGADVSVGIAWTHVSLFPPMIFSQDLDSMERNYADYWARVVVEAQQSALLAG